MNVFGMVTTRHAHQYTGHALASFFQTTDFGAGDQFFLIDNDGRLDPALAAGFPRVTILGNPTPRSFAANVNMVLHDTTTFATRGSRPGHRGLWPAVEEFLAPGHVPPAATV